MKAYVHTSSIIRKIWGKADVTLFIFAGSAAEFAVNREVDWLYFTGRLPADPIGRLFSTVNYAQQIIFSEEKKAFAAVENITAIHRRVELSRSSKIPPEAFHDVLYMLIYYSIASFELLERKLSENEKDEVLRVFRDVGVHMGMIGIPDTYAAWYAVYTERMQHRLLKSVYTADLFRQYKKHLGTFRYLLLLEVQRALVPPEVNRLLHLGAPRFLRVLLPLYRLIRKLGLQGPVIRSLVPRKFRKQVREMERH